MKQIILSIICLFLILPFGYCQDLKQPPTISIKSDKQVYEIGEEIKVEVKIKNISQDKILIQTLPAFSLSSKGSLGIWSPVKFDKENFYLNANEKTLLQLEPLEEKTFEYNLSQLRWDKQISSKWPSCTLQSFLEPGSYSLVLGVELFFPSLKNKLTSNSITIEVKGKKELGK